ncbi:hypothetical protein PC121_g5391 [Phytophthora cactorum]|nr:hypothetical protein PC121_g5391 [Phytophthora cactorum]
MDFTHGTNNLGYHLGSLVVTTATGRGFPVFGFICLNEQALRLLDDDDEEKTTAKSDALKQLSKFSI